jgi:hypothetical protein
MPQLLPVIAYYVATQIPTLVAYATAIFVASSVAVGAYQARRARRSQNDAYNASLRDRSVVLRTTVAPKYIGYGEAVFSGVLTYALSYGSNKEKLALVIALQPGHEITAIDEIYFNDEALGTLDGSGNVTTGRYAPNRTDISHQHNTSSTQSASQVVAIPYLPVGGSVTAFANPSADGWQALTVVSVGGTNVTIDTSGVDVGVAVQIDFRRSAQTSYVQVRKYLGAASQTADAALVAASGGAWTSAHRGRGQPYIVVELTYNEDIFPTGVPQIKVKGRLKKVYDPRTATTAYSNNAALAVRDYLKTAFGCADSEIDDTLVTAAANICDELVPIHVDGSTQRRYTTNGLVSTESNRMDNLAMLSQAMGGVTVWSQGKWRIFAGAYRSPTLTLDEDDLADRDSISIQPRAPRRDLFNAVRGTFVDPNQGWQEVDFPPVTNATYETQDGSERVYADVPLPLTTDPWRAQRLGKIVLETGRQAMSIEATFKLTAYDTSPGKTVSLSLSRYGFSSKVFQVVERDFSISNGVKLTLREITSDAWDWNYGEATEIDSAPNTTLPSPWTVNPISGLSVASGDDHFQYLGDGTLIARIFASWTAPSDAGITTGGVIELQYRSNPDTEWRSIPPMPGSTTSTYISPVEEQLFYQIRIRGRNDLGIASSWTYSEQHYVATKAALPGNVASLTVTELGPKTRRLAWTMSTTPGDLAGFEIRYQSGATFSWGAATFFASQAAVDASASSWSLETTLPAAGTWSFGVKALDTSGNESASPATALNVLLGDPGSVRPPDGWGESICPDPYFADVAWWTTSVWTQPGFYFEDSNGVDNAPFVMGVRRSANLWSGTYTGTNDIFLQSDLWPYSGVGQVLRLKARAYNTSNRDLRVGIQYHDINSTFIDFDLITWPAGSGISTREAQMVVPSGTAFILWSVHSVANGNPFTGLQAVSEIKLNHASGTTDVIAGAIVDTMSTSLADGYDFGRYATITDASTIWNTVHASLAYTPTVDGIAELEAFGNLFVQTASPGSTIGTALGVLIKQSTEALSTSIVDPGFFGRTTITTSSSSAGESPQSVYIRRRFNLTADTAYTFELRGQRRPDLPSTSYNKANGLRFRLTYFKR